MAVGTHRCAAVLETSQAAAQGWDMTRLWVRHLKRRNRGRQNRGFGHSHLATANCHTTGCFRDTTATSSQQLMSSSSDPSARTCSTKIINSLQEMRPSQSQDHRAQLQICRLSIKPSVSRRSVIAALLLLRRHIGSPSLLLTTGGCWNSLHLYLRLAYSQRSSFFCFGTTISLSPNGPYCHSIP